MFGRLHDAFGGDGAAVCGVRCAAPALQPIPRPTSPTTLTDLPPCTSPSSPASIHLHPPLASACPQARVGAETAKQDGERRTLASEQEVGGRATCPRVHVFSAFVHLTFT